VHFQKAIDLGKEVGDQREIKESVLCLAECYVEMNRVEQAMDPYKSQCS
jgi:hypothetical protein